MRLPSFLMRLYQLDRNCSLLLFENSTVCLKLGLCLFSKQLQHSSACLLPQQRTRGRKKTFCGRHTTQTHTHATYRFILERLRLTVQQHSNMNLSQKKEEDEIKS